jgi:hypothetical protein
MRILLLLLAVACWWTYQNFHSAPGEGAEPLPPVSSSSATHETRSEGWALDGLWASEPEESVADATEVVLCRVGTETSYLRRSDCASAGGFPSSEPSWAQAD